MDTKFIKIYWQKIKNYLDRQPRYLIYTWSFLFFLLLTYMLRADPSSSHVKTTLSTIDTYTPPGYVLIPIEVLNYESLDQILGQYGVVDLYIPKVVTGKKSRLVAKSLKIIRSPVKANHFGVLVPEHKAPSVLNYEGPFSVTILNPKSIGTKFVKPKVKRLIITENPQ